MAGVMNNTARQFNLKAVDKGHRVCVRLAPGFNVVDDKDWQAFVPKKGDMLPYLSQLVDKGHVAFGEKYDDMELERKPDTKTKVSRKPMDGGKGKGQGKSKGNEE